MGARLWVKDVVKWTCLKCRAEPLEWCRAVLENQPILPTACSSAASVRTRARQHLHDDSDVTPGDALRFYDECLQEAWADWILGS